MFQTVVAGVDGHEGGLDAIALASVLVEPDARVTLAHVFSGAGHHPAGTRAAADNGEQAPALDLLERARQQSGIDAELEALAARSAARGLHTAAKDTAADLIVVGSSRRGPVGRVLLGDDANSVLRGAPCAVAIAPAGYSRHAHSIDKVAVGYDGSAESKDALAFARKLAGQHGARLAAFEAVSLPNYATAAGWAAPLEGSFEGVIDDARREVSALQGVEPHAAYGQAADVLARYSASVDLLVVGSREYGTLGRLVHGSTSEQLARTARCPLLVLNRAARAAELRGVHEGGRVAA